MEADGLECTIIVQFGFHKDKDIFLDVFSLTFLGILIKRKQTWHSRELAPLDGWRNTVIIC